MTQPMKRVHFFDHQTLRAVDLTAEQDYHRAMRHLHNRALHNWGICDGLAVTADGTARVAIAPGLAFDREGREIVLGARITLDLTPLNLPDNADCWVLAAYGQRAADPTSEGGVADHTRWLEQAEITLSATASPDPGLSLVLACVKRTGPNVASIDGTTRVDIGLPDAAELQALLARKVDRQGAATMTGPLTIDTALSAGDVTARGTLKVTGASTLSGGLSLTGAATFSGPLTVGTPAARQNLTVNGDLLVQRGLIHAGRSDGSVVGAGEAAGGIGFWGPGVQHAQLTFRAGAGFELVDRSQDGPGLNYPAGRYPYADLRARTVFASGSLTVGAGGNGTLVARHIDGKRADNDGADALFLNWGTGFPVAVGGNRPADLQVTGDLHLAAGRTLRNPGRLHIFSEERMYLLAKGAVFLGADWGGPGDLYVSGSIYCAGRGPGDRPAGHGAGIITWDVEALGGVYSPTKRFLIDHPLHPERRHLVHACIEGPENGVYYRGEAVLSGGEARIELPEYFEALTCAEGRTVLLTAKLGERVAQLCASEVVDGAFTVRGIGGDPAQAFWWEVKAVRSDIEPLDVDRPKVDELVGVA